MTAQTSMFRRGGSGARAPKKPTNTNPVETREGTVEKVVFESDRGFRILRVKVGKLVQTWLGTVPAATSGMGVRGVGQHARNEKFGEDQFELSEMTPVLPSDLAGIEHFLGSGLVKGVGPAKAKLIVEHFGDKVFDALEQPLLLSKVRGLTAALADDIAVAWEDQKAVRDVLVFLQKNGASPNLAGKIYSHYKAVNKDAVEVMKANPYQLAMDVDGVGFDTADKLALTMGVGADSPERVKAGVLHVVHDATGKGHTYTLRDEVAAVASEMLEVNTKQVDEVIGYLAKEKRVFIERLGGGDGEAVFSPAMYRAEQRVAERIAVLLSEPSGIPMEDDGGEDEDALGLEECVDEAIADFEASEQVTLAPAQRDAVRMAAKHKVLVLTGGPGVGKTTILLALLQLYEKARLTVRLAAPTGRAAKRMSETTGDDAKTIHSLLSFDHVTKGFKHHAGNRIPTNVVVLDESSMLDCRLSEQLLDAIPDGARVVFVGDIDQLPSVGAGAVLRDIILSGVVPTVRLTQIFRQAKGSTISVNAALINEGKAPVGDEGIGGEFYWFKVAEPVVAQDEIVDLVTKRIPEKFGIPSTEIQVLTPMHKYEVGTIALNTRLQAVLNPDGEAVTVGGTELRVGDRVFVNKNNGELDVANGDIGRVIDVNPDSKDAFVTVDIDGRAVEFGRDIAGTLQLAYAVSIHKSQGGQFACVVIALATQHFVLLSRNLLYTAVTRGKKLVCMVADPKAVKMAVGSARKDDRQTRLAARLREATGAR